MISEFHLDDFLITDFKNRNLAFMDSRDCEMQINKGTGTFAEENQVWLASTAVGEKGILLATGPREASSEPARLRLV